MDKITVLSLFDGISCARTALDRAGIPVSQYFASEIDQHAIRVTQSHYPDTIQVGDVCGLNCLTLPKVNLLVGGSPCTSLSSSGKQEGFDGASGLFYQYLRVLSHLLSRNPDILFFLENVKMKKEWQDTISQALGVEPLAVNSARTSGQNRQRLYWANFPLTQPEDKGILLKDIIESGFVDREKSYCIDANYAKGGNINQYFNKSRRQLVFPTLEDLEKGKNGDTSAKFRKLTPLEVERLQNLPENYTAALSNTQRYKCVGNGWTVDTIAHFFKGLPIYFSK